MVRCSRTICYALFLLGLLPAATAPLVATQTAAAKKTVTGEADLPRFSYPVTGSASDLLLSDDATFDSFAQKVTADVNSTLTGYDIQDKAALRGLLYSKLDGQILSGDTEGAATTLDKIRDLEEKPEAKMMSGLTFRASLQARKDSGASAGPEYEKAFAKDFTASVNALPWAPVQDRIKGMKANYQILSPDYLLSELKVHGDPEALRSKSIDFPTATDLLDLRVLIKLQLPVKNRIVAALTTYIDAHKVQKPDIWPAREVTLLPGEKLTPVRVAILDTGVDTALYTGQLYTDPAPGPHGPHGLAYDTEGKIYAADLQLLTAEQKELYPKVLSLRQGFNDLRSNIDSPEAADARKYMSTTPPTNSLPS